MRAHWEHFEHDADIGVRGYGATKGEAFEQAALALTAVVCDPARVAARETVRFDCAAADDELLLVRWLNAVAAEMGARRMLFSRYAVQLDAGGGLAALAAGEPATRWRHEPAVEVKGATCTALRVAPCEDGWLAQTVLDV